MTESGEHPAAPPADRRRVDDQVPAQRRAPDGEPAGARENGAGSDHQPEENQRPGPEQRPEPSSYRPVVGQRPLRRFEILVRRREVRAHVGVVLVTLSGDHHGFKPERQPTMGELLWKGSGTLYEIDMGRHWTRIELELPSRSEAFAFNAVINVEWWVEEPVLIVKNGVYDVRKALDPHLWQRLSAITRRFEVEESAEAEAMAADLAELPVGIEYGLVTRAFLRLKMDTPTVHHASAVRDVQHKIELERATQQLRLLREESTAKLIGIRVTRYREILLSGDYDQFALQLAQNPDEVPAVVQMLRDERHNNQRAVTDFVTRLLDSGAIDRHEIDDQVREALRWLKQATDSVLVGPDAPDRLSGRGSEKALPAAEIPQSELPEPPMPPPPEAP